MDTYTKSAGALMAGMDKFNLSYSNRSDEYHGLSIAGPNSRKVLQK